MTERPVACSRAGFGHYVAGPLIGMMLVDLGAEVIRVDPPGGPRRTDQRIQTVEGDDVEAGVSLNDVGHPSSSTTSEPARRS